MSIVENKETISIILGLLLPGAGHIYLGYKHKGIKIAISFVIITIIFVNIIPNSVLNYLNDYLNEYVNETISKYNQSESEFRESDFTYRNLFEDIMRLLFNIMSGLVLIAPFVIWYKQIKDLLKITNIK